MLLVLVYMRDLHLKFRAFVIIQIVSCNLKKSIIEIDVLAYLMICKSPALDFVELPQCCNKLCCQLPS